MGTICMFCFVFCTVAFRLFYTASFQLQCPLKCCKIINNMICSEIRRLQSNLSLKKVKSLPEGI